MKQKKGGGQKDSIVISIIAVIITILMMARANLPFWFNQVCFVICIVMIAYCIGKAFVLLRAKHKEKNRK